MKNGYYTIGIILFLFLIGCKEKYTPKPYGFYRIDFPAKSYHLLADSFPYRFDIADNALVEPDRAQDAEPGWINISYPAYNAKIHLSYKKIQGDSSLARYLEDCHHLAYTHTIKAESINERTISREHLFGLVYYIEGNTASSTQFFVTDSTRHFLRGALYFNEHPNKDSLAPVITYLREDIINLMETIRFKQE